jgi:pimeloyl-ACP methyl ester carboxylesterase
MPRKETSAGVAALTDELEARVRGANAPAIARDVSARFTIDGHSWTLIRRRGRFALQPGTRFRPDVRISTSLATLRAMLDGSTSGVDAFLDGALFVRGNLALSLQLDGIFDSGNRPARMPRARRVQARGIDTFYLEAGAGPCVVLLHGLGATNASMLPTLRALSPTYRVIAPDLPGFGDSDKPIRAYHPAFFAAWAASLLDELGIDRAHFIGNSMGGRISIEMGLRHPSRVNKLVLFAPSMAFLKYRQLVPVVRFLMPELAVVPLFLPRSRAVAGLRSMFHVPSRLALPWYEAAIDEFLRIFKTPRGRIAFFSAARQIYLEDARGRRGFWDRLEGLDAPSLFLWGQHDRLVPLGFSRHAARSIPHARSIVLEGCGHVPQFELPDRTHALVHEFLATPTA